MPAAARTTSSGVSLAERALELDAGLYERGAEEVVRLDGATVVSTPSLPLVPHLNTLLVHDALGGEAVEALADEHLAGLANQRVVARSEAAGERLAGELPARGWTAYRLAFLSRPGSEPPPVAAELAEEVPYGQVRGLRREWLSAEPWALEGEALEQTLAGDERLFTGTPPRAFAVFEVGRPLAYALLLDGGRDGMLEDVYTTPSARGRALAAATISAVLHAARAARHEAVFVATDGAGSAPALYERLGFAPLAEQHVFSRTVA